MPNLQRPFRIRKGWIIGWLAAIMAGFMALMYVIPGTNCSMIWQEWVIVGGWYIIGLLMAIRAVRRYGDDFCSGMDFKDIA